MPKGRKVPPKEEQTQRDDVAEADKQYIKMHESRIWQDANRNYQQRGRGAMLLDFQQARGFKAPAFYMTTTDERFWMSPDIAQAVNTYDPETEFVFVFIGRPDNPEDVTVRSYRHRYRTMAA